LVQFDDSQLLVTMQYTSIMACFFYEIDVKKQKNKPLLVNKLIHC